MHATDKRAWSAALRAPAHRIVRRRLARVGVRVRARARVRVRVRVRVRLRVRAPHRAQG